MLKVLLLQQINWPLEMVCGICRPSPMFAPAC